MWPTRENEMLFLAEGLTVFLPWVERLPPFAPTSASELEAGFQPNVPAGVPMPIKRLLRGYLLKEKGS